MLGFIANMHINRSSIKLLLYIVFIVGHREWFILFPLGHQPVKKLELFRPEQGKDLPTFALILLSDELQKQYFPYSKIECARFKGALPGNFIDPKTIDISVGLQPEQAYQFVLRHIPQGTTDYTGVYRNDRWEYPAIAIREVIRNAFTIKVKSETHLPKFRYGQIKLKF